MLLIGGLNRYSGLPDCNVNGSGFVKKRKDQNAAILRASARTKMPAQARLFAARETVTPARDAGLSISEDSAGGSGDGRQDVLGFAAAPTSSDHRTRDSSR
jgi:hypothetical protein